MTENTAASTMTEAELLEKFAEIPSAPISDGQDRLNVLDAGISSVWPSPGARLVGRAVTLTVGGGDNAGVHAVVDSLTEGDVLVINGQGLTHRALIGELIASRAKKRGCRGFVIDGCVRDAVDLQEINFPVFARGVTPAGPYRNGPYRIGGPVAVGNVAVSPGDLVIGDDDGVVVVARDEAEQVLAAAQAKLVAEEKQRAEIGL
ncbi:RraA family protein [Citricoccus sp. NR2]|uniref:RraA family protein n=1 Tax=Citricoccus sp. NR2 TaxID=3004095 RepID=UPI0022DD4ADA|nr:methyltransferase [Citricoccus sp. NR2]WBL19277.1 methyltransferase [Citricoccus sp. NR2]